MIEYDPGSTVDVIDVTLFRYNHYDNLIWTKCLNQIDYLRMNDDAIIVSPYQMKTMLEINFEKELNRIMSANFDLLHKDASSLFFLNKLVDEFENLKWIKLSLNKKRHFSRMVEDFNGNNRQIKYSFKIMKITVRLSHILPGEVIAKINPTLKKINLTDGEKPFKAIRLKSLIASIEAALNTMDLDDETAEAFSWILDTFDQKVEGDNPEVLFVTDW